MKGMGDAGKLTHGVTIHCKQCGVVVTLEHAYSARYQCPGCEGYDVEELLMYFYSPSGDVIQRTSSVLVPIKQVRLDPKAIRRFRPTFLDKLKIKLKAVFAL